MLARRIRRSADDAHEPSRVNLLLSSMPPAPVGGTGRVRGRQGGGPLPTEQTLTDLERFAQRVDTLERLAAKQHVQLTNLAEHVRRVLLVVGAAGAMLDEILRKSCRLFAVLEMQQPASRSKELLRSASGKSGKCTTRFCAYCARGWMLSCARTWSGRVCDPPLQKPYDYGSRYAKGMGYILEDHFVTLWRCWH